MKTLVFKELKGTAVFLLAGAFCVSAVILDGGAERAWHMYVEPRFRDAEALMAIGMIGGFLLGFAVFFGEQIHRTFEYLAHRPVSLGRIVAGKFLACAVVLWAWLLVPLVLQFAIYALWDPALHLYEFGRVGTWHAFWTLSFSACAAGCFVAALRAHPVLRLLLAGVLLVALLSSSWLLLGPRGGTASPVLFALFHLAATGALGLAGWWTLREGADPDMPASFGRVGLTGLLLAAALVMAGGLGITSMQGELRGSLYASYPSVARSSQGEFLLRRWVREEGDVLLFDRHHSPIPETGDAAGEAAKVWDPWDQRPRNPPSYEMHDRWWSDPTGFFGEHRPLDIEIAGHYAPPMAYLDTEERLVRAYLRDRTDRRVSRVITFGRGAGDEPFVGDVIAGRVDGQGHHLLIDRGDRSLWLLRGGRFEEGLTRLSLPDGDELLSAMALGWRANDQELSAWPWLNRHNMDFLIRGENGLYVWRDDKLVDAPGPLVQLAERLVKAYAVSPVRVVKTDMITPIVELLDEDGRMVGRHEYRPYTFTEKIEAGAIYGLSLLRAPLLQVASFSSDHHPLDQRTSLEGGDSDLIDPLIAGARHPLTLLLGILLAAACAGSAAMRLRRFGASVPRMVLWGGLVLLGGPLVLLAYYAMERHRAWRSTPVLEETEPPRMLLRTG